MMPTAVLITAEESFGADGDNKVSYSVTTAVS